MMSIFSNISNKDWDEEELSSDSQVTLIKFDQQLIQNKEETLTELLHEYDNEDRKFFIIDKNKGEIVDMRNGAIIQKFQTVKLDAHTSNIPKKTKKREHRLSLPDSTESSLPKRESQIGYQNVWDDYWDNSEKIHRRFLMSICQKDYHFFNEMLNKKFNPYPINVNYRSFDNWTPLHFAALHGNIVAIETLLSFPHVSFNILTNFKETPFIIACKNNKLEVVKMLLDAHVNCNIQDEDGSTGLHYAIQLGHKQIAKLLVEKQSVDLTIKNNKGLTAKDLCSSLQLVKIFEPDHQQKSHKFAFFNTLARKNRHIEKLLMKIQPQQEEEEKQKKQKKVTLQSHHKKAKQKESKVLSKKQNIARMYQMLKQKRPAETIGLSSFKFYKKIGEGAFGEVYIVKKGKSQKLYALKAIKKQKIIGTNLIRYVQTEKEVLSLIKHPFIVHLNYSFQTETHLFLVMDYCQGGDLGHYLEKKKKFDEETVRSYAAEILLALEALHQEKIIYRDMKPDNIVLDSEGHALLTDFGLSKKTASIDDLNKSFCGTPAYLPLEMINKKGHNRMADWYEYGIVLYELYTGIPPFFAETKAELYQNVRTGIIRFPRGTPQPFRDFIKRLLSQNPERRLGFVNDSLSVKQHRWFDGVDWEAVYNRELVMPKIENKILVGEQIKTKFSEQKGDKHLVNDWSFIAA